MRELQGRIIAGAPELGVARPAELLQQIRRRLLEASQSDRLRSSQEAIYRHVTMNTVAGGEHYCIEGGVKDFKRRESSARLVRDDRAWLHFSITLGQAGRTLEMLAYDFELVFPPENTPRFVRIDLNHPGHDNDAKGLRSHAHPGHDDLQIPSPIMTPIEILDLMIEGMRARDPTRPRAS